jgi:hypothetical protein
MTSLIIGLGIISTGAFSAEEKIEIKWGALAQPWLVNDTTVTSAKPNFRLRRAEMKLSAQLTESVKFFIMADPAKALSTTSTTVVTATTPAVTTTTVSGINASGDNRILQDLGVTVIPIENLEVTLGQFKTPTVQEGLDSSSELPLPERSIGARTLGDRREPGGMISYKYAALKTSLMLSNGTGTNVDDTNNNKDITLRLDYEIMPELKVGGFTQAANFSYGDRARHGLNIRWTDDTLLARAEWMYQSSGNNSVKANGFTVDGGYTFDKWQPVARFEYYRPNTSVDLTGQAFTLGMNYLFKGHKAKIQAAYSYLMDMTGPNGTPVVAASTKGVKGSLWHLVFSASL